MTANYIILLRRWQYGCLLFLLYSCNDKLDYQPLIISKKDSIIESERIKNAHAAIKLVEKDIHSGDLVTRTGADFTSESLRNLNQRDHTYSHCGIASIEHDSVFVYHALGGDWNPDQKIRKDALQVFADPVDTRGIGVYRYSLPEERIHDIMTTAKQLRDIGVVFDMKFDLASNDRMYCAEYVYKSCLMGSKGQLNFHISHIKEFAFIGVDDLFLQPKCKQLKRVLFK